MEPALCFQQENYSNTEHEGLNSQGYLPPLWFAAFFLQAHFYITHHPTPQIELGKGCISPVNSWRKRLAWNTSTKYNSTGLVSSFYRSDHIFPFSRGESPLLYLVLKLKYLNFLSKLLTPHEWKQYPPIFNIDRFDQHKFEKFTSKSFWKGSGLSLIENRNTLGHLIHS